MKAYNVTVIIDYHGQDVSAVFSLFSECEICAKTAVLSMMNDFFTRDGDAYVAKIEEA